MCAWRAWGRAGRGGGGGERRGARRRPGRGARAGRAGAGRDEPEGLRCAALTRDSLHKRRATGGRRNIYKKKRKFESGRPAAMTKLGEKQVHLVRTRGGNTKFRALRLQEGNFSWASETTAQKVRILDVAYNSSNNELVRTKTLVKSSIVSIDAVPFRKWFEAHYHCDVGVKGAKPTPKATAGVAKDKLAATHKALEGRLDPRIQEQLATGRVLAIITSSPGQSGRADGYILEGKELDFYARQIQKKKGSK